MQNLGKKYKQVEGSAMKNSNSGLNDVVVSKAIEHEIYLCLEFELNMDFFYVSSEK